MRIFTILMLLISSVALGQPSLPLDFESSTITYTFTDFDGGAATVISNPQSNGINTSAKVGKMVKSAGQVWGGSLISLGAPIDFSTNKTFKVKVFMPRVGAKLLLKVENQANSGINFEKEAIGTVANAWEELTFDYSTVNTANQYQKVVLIFDLGTVGDGSANFTYLFDDIRLMSSGGGGSNLPALPLDFESATIPFTFTDFDGGAATVIANPQSNGINTSAKIGKMVKGAGQVWGGSSISLGAPIDFSTNKTFKVKVFMPRVGAKLLLKVENQANSGINFEKEAVGTVANAWEELTFDYSTVNTANQYQKVVLIFDLGTAGDGSANFTYLFDDIRLVAGGGGGLTQMNLPVTFDDATVEYGLLGFGGAEASTIVTDPTNAANKVAKVIKSATAELWAGTTVSTPNGSGFSTKIPFTATDKKMSVRVWSPNSGIKVRLKVEDSADGTKSVETEATSTVANNWETLTFDFANQATGTAALNLAFNYNKASIFFNFGVTGATAGEKTYYFDDVKFAPAGGGLTQMNLPVTFDDATVEYGLLGFGGAEASTVVTDPTNAANKVAKVIKSATAELWAGTTVSTPNGSGFSTKIPFTATDKKMSVRVWSPNSGIKVRLKVEDSADGTKSVETEATSTVANNWETLTFDFANQATGTAALNLAFNYNKASIFFNFGVTGATAGEKTYYFDDVKFGSGVVVGIQTITFPAITDKTVGNPAFQLTATASSNLPVSYSTTSDKVTIAGSTVTIVKAGRVAITASQAGNASFEPAADVTQSFCIKPAKPTVTVSGTNTEAITLTSSASVGNKWYLNGTAIPSATNATLTVTAAGVYKVQVVIDDCASEFSSDTPLIVTGDLPRNVNAVGVYPNPIDDKLELIGIKGELSNVQLVDLAGRQNSIVFEKHGDNYQANVQHLSLGIYVLQVQDGAMIYRIKVIKK
jgi:hypothetical protein